MSRKKVIVTGGTGYIGSHTAVKVIESGYQVVIVDNLSNSNIDVLEGIRAITGEKPIFVQADLSNEQAAKSFFRDFNDAAAVIHIAAFKAVGESVEKPLKYYHNNIGSLLQVLSCMAEYRIPHVIFSSSATVYGDPDALPLTEESPVKPATSPYGNTKQIGEEIIRDAVQAGLIGSAISLRYFNPVGAHASAIIGELPLGTPNNLMPFITQTAAGIREQLKVFGDDYNTPDGTAIRDYIHIEDLAEAHIVALKHLLQRSNRENYEVFNLGTGKGYTVLEVIRSFEKMSGLKLNYTFAPRRPGDVEATYADPARADSLLGWTAKYDLHAMTASAWAWEKRLRGIH